MNKKQCIKCKIIKDTSEFYKDSSRHDNLEFYCKDCRKLYKYQFPWKQTLKYIKDRCNNINNKQYKNYGERVIKCLITEEELKFLWFRDKAYEMKKPSIDRKDNNGNYCLENCQYIELSINAGKDKFRPILQFSLNGEFIKKWNSLQEIEDIYHINHTCISNCCSGKIKKSHNFIWIYEK
jgi:hypothetical protein